jgi:hypothetical protein
MRDATMPGVKRVGVAGSILFIGCLLAGCGSGGHGYTLDATRTCLEKAGDKTDLEKDAAISGSQGNLRVHFGYGTESIVLAFGKDANEAQALQNKAVTITQQHAQLDRKTIIAGTRIADNVFYFSTFGPVTGVLDGYITACLKK